MQTLLLPEHNSPKRIPVQTALCTGFLVIPYTLYPIPHFTKILRLPLNRYTTRCKWGLINPCPFGEHAVRCFTSTHHKSPRLVYSRYLVLVARCFGAPMGTAPWQSISKGLKTQSSIATGIATLACCQAMEQVDAMRAWNPSPSRPPITHPQLRRRPSHRSDPIHNGAVVSYSKITIFSLESQLDPSEVVLFSE